jgi:hypothetical protein
MNDTPVSGGDNSPLAFDPNEKLVSVNSEHVTPKRRPPLAQVSAAQPENTRDKQARATFTELVATPPTPPEPRKPVVTETLKASTDATSVKPGLPLTTEAPKNATSMHEDVFLPSNFLPYAWKDIQVRRFNIEEIRAIIRARNSNNLRHLIRAVDATITRPVTDLTMGDFWFLMYWHRLNSYKKAPFIIQWSCVNEQHIDWIENGRKKTDGAPGAEPEIEKISPETLKNLLTIAKSNLVTPEIDKDKYETVTENLWQEYGLRVKPQSIVDFVNAIEEDAELLETRGAKRKERDDKAAAAGDVDTIIDAEEELNNAVDDEDRGFMYRYAALLDPTHHGHSLKDRVTWLNDQAPDMLVDLEELLEVTDHGVTESWTVTCKECAHQRTITQSLDALTFLPSLQRGRPA